MKRSKTSSFVITRRIRPEPWVDDLLTRKFNAANRIFNSGAKHCIRNLNAMRKNPEYNNLLQQYRIARDNNNTDLQKEISTKLSEFHRQYGLTEYEIQKYLAEGYQRSYKGCLGANIIQKISTSLSVSVNSAIYNGTKIHYRKFGQTDYFEDKTAVSGIIYKSEEDAVFINKRKYKLKPVRKSDAYMKEAITHKIKYCGILRKPFKNGYRYFVQFTMEGNAPTKDEHLYPRQVHKHTLGEGKIGVDEGTSTCAYYGNDTAGYRILAEGVEKYNSEIVKYSQIYERRVRKNNPDCYDKNGTRIKGKKNYRHTKGMYKALMALKDAYRKKSAFVKQQHNILANEIISHCDEIVKEPMNFNGLAKKSKTPTERQDKKTVITDKNGNKKSVRKHKKKKRFGKSVQDKSPGLFNSILTEKMNHLGGTVTDIDKFKYKASQYNHLTRETVKVKLGDRTKQVGNHIVQRDLYSAFLLSEMKDTETIDFDKCDRDFNRFLEQQERIINEMMVKERPSANFGLKEFLKERETA